MKCPCILIKECVLHVQVHTVADVHQPEDNDSGHCSSYEGAGPVPVGGVDNDEYLVPVSPDNSYSLECKPKQTSYSFDNKAKPNIYSFDKKPKQNIYSVGKPTNNSPASPPDKTSKFGAGQVTAPQLRQPKPLTARSDSTNRNSGGARIADRNRFSQGSAKSFGDYRNLSHDDSGSLQPSPCEANTSCASSAPPTSAGPILSPNSVSSKSKLSDFPRFQSSTRVYGAGPSSSSAGRGSQSMQSPTVTSPVSPSANPFAKYHMHHPSQPSEEASHPSPSPNTDLTNGASQPLLDEAVKVRPVKSRNGVGPGKFMSNTSSGYNSDLSSGEPSPPADYRVILEDVTETDILV